jgi:hypothetical protein
MKKRLTDRGRIPKKNSSISIDFKGGEKNIGMERKRTCMKIGGASMRMRIVVSKCFHQCQRGILLKD